jgi:hypothetical protein
MSKEINNLNTRRKRLGLSLLRYFHAFMHGYSEKRMKWKHSPYKQESLTTAYWEGRRTRYDYDSLNRCDLKTKNSLTLER